MAKTWHVWWDTNECFAVLNSKMRMMIMKSDESRYRTRVGEWIKDE
jgi:hypothetical protein